MMNGWGQERKLGISGINAIACRCQLSSDGWIGLLYIEENKNKGRGKMFLIKFGEAYSGLQKWQIAFILASASSGVILIIIHGGHIYKF